jgi:hypothetical protein
MVKRFFGVLSAVIICILALGACSNGVQGYPAQELASEYRLTIYPKPEHGTLLLSHTAAPDGTWIRVYVNPDPEYKLKTGSLRWKDDIFGAKLTQINLTGYYYHGILGTSDKVITAEFEKNTDSSMVTVSVDRNITNGIIVADPVYAAPGTAVTLHIIPKPGYVLKDGSFSVKDKNGGVVNGTAISPNIPYTFILPAQDVVISAEFASTDFNGYLINARKHAQAGKFDIAAEFYEKAYQLRSDGAEADVQEVIFYVSLARLGKILTDPYVRTLFKSLIFDVVPTNLDDWICDPASWVGDDNNRWYNTWQGQEYNSALPSDPLPSWAKDADTSPDWAQNVEYESRNMILPRRFGRISGFHVSFSDTPLYQEMNPNTPQKFFNLLFWTLITTQPDGFNILLQTIDTRLFGDKFEQAAALAATLSPDAEIILHPNLKIRFSLDKYYGSGETKVGKTELDYIFGVLRAIKAAVQYLRAYEWSINLRPWTGLSPLRPIEPNEGLDQILDNIFSDAEDDEEPTRWKSYWQEAATISRVLPFKNRDFLTMRNSGYLDKAKDNLLKALTMINNSMTYWHGAGSNFSDDAKTNYQWARTGFSQAKSALDSGERFHFPKKLPVSGPTAQWPPNPAAADYAIDVTEFFTPGAFTLKNLFTTERHEAAPSLFKIRWYIDGSGRPVFTTQAALVTEPITDDGAEANVAGSYSAPYGIWSFEVNTENLRKIFPKGFAQNKYGRKTGDKAYLYEVFPTIPLWPARPTYFIGMNGRRTAKSLYKYYH